MGTAKDVLRIAATELGYTESPAGSNKTKFAAEAGHANGQPWCATYVVAMFRRAGVKLPSESAWTPSMYAAMSKVRGGFPGDVVFFDFPDGSKGIQHVGILESATSGTVTCIEGNTNPGDAGSQSNGGGVYRRTRPRSVVAGIGRPAYSAAAPAPPVPVAPAAPTPTLLEVDMQLQILNVTINTDGDGNGWASVPVHIDKIIGCLPQGLRPGADGRYDFCDVTFAQEDPNTIVSVIGWVPNGSSLVRLRVAT